MLIDIELEEFRLFRINSCQKYSYKMPDVLRLIGFEYRMIEGKKKKMRAFFFFEIVVSCLFHNPKFQQPGSVQEVMEHVCEETPER